MITEFLQKDNSASAGNIPSVLTEGLKGEKIIAVINTYTASSITLSQHILVFESGTCFWFLSNGAFGIENKHETSRLLETVANRHRDSAEAYDHAKTILQTITQK
jgi:hypothetical protein